MEKVPRVNGKQYVVKVNSEAVYVSDKLQEARDYIRNMQIKEEIQEVELVKETFTELILNKFKPKIERTLSIDEFTLED
jgi:hypothetical protein